MKILILMACLLLSVKVVLAAETGASKKGNSKAKLGTSFKFDGTTLRGKYQTSLGTNATVEDDKYLDDLLGGRKSFSDRIKKDDQRN
jgi:hypothetical protein